MATLTSCTLPRTNVNRNGKNTAKSLFGVIFSWMLLQHTKVLTILKGLIYGMGHAVYSISDPRERVFKGFVEQLARDKGLSLIHI